MKHYKLGQFVSIGGKLARIHETKIVGHSICKICRVNNECNNPCGIHASECLKKLGTDLYPIFIKHETV